VRLERSKLQITEAELVMEMVLEPCGNFLMASGTEARRGAIILSNRAKKVSLVGS